MRSFCDAVNMPAAPIADHHDGEPVLSEAKRRLLDRLKRADGLTAAELAVELAITESAVRLHLDVLAGHGLVARRDRAAAGRGRPPVEWVLTDLGTELFPDRHGDLTVELIEALRAAMGDDGLDAVIAARTAVQIDGYRRVIDREAPARKRVEALARRRSAEGYMAEAVRDGDDWILVEHHCPVCAAATVCQGLCRGELELFRSALGDDVRVEREQHLLSGDSRCAYRIRLD